ncbi:MAG: hypothetical protein K0M63_10700 [Weeksellaceae bacterium]|nr:hypothetical protein [Weeksellaceae bacterium]
MKKIVFTSLLLATIISCKKETVTETDNPETTVTETRTVDSESNGTPDNTTTTDNSESENESDDAVSGGQETSEDYIAGSRRIKATFRHDAEGKPVAVISESGKADILLYRKGDTNVYALDGDGVSLTVSGNNLQINENGKTTTFNVD